ncbi:MAG: tetratricopeptide repeat protein, partial [Bacteroidales bacterium]|nr:tetratricopeptide repeat protein [Bacteroidales bacterium]
MKHIIIALALLILCSFSVLSQESKINEIRYDSQDLSSHTNSRMDLNGKRCALLKIISKDKLSAVQGNIIGGIEEYGLEKWVYITAGSKFVKLIFENSYPIMIVFHDYGIDNVSSDGAYNILVENNLSENVVKKMVLEDAIEAIKQGYYFRAFEICEKLTTEGDPMASMILGHCYMNGLGVEKDISKAIGYIQEASDKGNLYALCNLGFCYEKGIGVNKNTARAFYYYQKSAEAGSVIGQYNLGNCYHNGIGTPANDKDAYRWFKKAACKGYTDAIVRQALLVYTIEGINKQTIAKRDSLVGIAAEANHPVALEIIGSDLKFEGTNHKNKKAFEQALPYLQKSADMNYAPALVELGYMYWEGYGVKKNKEQAFRYMVKASELGYPDGSYQVGCMYRDGDGVKKNKQKKSEYWKRQREQEKT